MLRGDASMNYDGFGALYLESFVCLGIVSTRGIVVSGDIWRPVHSHCIG